MLLSMTGAILLYYPGTSPGGSAGNAVVGDNTPSDVTAGSGTTNTVSNEQTSGCPEETTSCPEEEAGCPDQQDVSALTSLAVCKCATGFWERATIYDWTVEKSILQTDGVEVSEDGSYAFAELASGETVTVHYQIAAERVVASESDVMGVSGYVRVTNTGLWPTENLKIVDHVQSSNGCGYEDVAVFNVDTSAHPVLCPGESYCYTYEHEFEAEAGACYLNLAVATITNMEPSCDGAGVSACARFSMPSEPTVTVVDESARLVEELQCPAGFECVPDVTGPWTLTGSKTLFVNVTVTNVDAPCGESFDLVNFANLTELDTCQKHSDSAVVELGYACEEDQSTTIAVEKTIDGSWTRGGGYTWGVEKIVTPNTVTLAQGETAQVTYVITVTRTPGSITDDVRVFGTVTVTNTGGNSTDGLAVLDTLYVSIDGTEHLLASKDISVSAKPVLAAGESYTYDYSFDVTNDVLALLQGPPMLASPMDLQTPGQGLLTELSFRNVASANITNYEGHEGSAFAVTDEATHVISGPPELTDIDEQAILEDVFGTLPAGFTVSNMTQGPWILNDNNIASGRVSTNWKADITNVNAECGSTYYVNNSASITASDTGEVVYSNATVTIQTPECTCGGCTLTIGYWKNHAGLGNGNQQDGITPLLQDAGGSIWLGTPNGEKSVAITSASQAVNYLDRQGDSSNGINRLYAQLLAAKLNIQNGACPNVVSSTIAAADAFLATHNADDWSSLTTAQQSQVDTWKTTLDDYNNGRIGPGHCA